MSCWCGAETQQHDYPPFDYYCTAVSEHEPFADGPAPTDLSKVAGALEAEAREWADLPTGRPGQPGYLFPTLLLALADRIRKADS